MNEISVQAMEFGKKVYKNFIRNGEDTLAIAIGGSVARGYAEDGCDIDIIYFEKKLKHYQKEKVEIGDWKIELHYAPHNFADLLYYTISPLVRNPYNVSKNDIDFEQWGEKRCIYQDKKKKDGFSDLKLILAAWRELKKLLDSIIIIEKDGWLNNLQNRLSNVEINKDEVFKILQKLRGEEDAVEASILVLKLQALLKGNVFSKVYWTDYYLATKENYHIKSLFNKMLDFDTENLNVWVVCAENMINYLSDKHKTYHNSCNICNGEFGKCNLGRCAGDYLNDTTKAINNQNPLGTILSLKRIVDYANKLMDIIDNNSLSMPQNWYEFWNRNTTLNKEILNELIDYIIEN